MCKPLLCALGFSMLTAAGSFAWSQTPSATPAQLSSPAALAPAETRSETLQVRPELAVSWQMQALDRRARVDMLLYTGQFGHSERASTMHPLGAVALSLSAGK